MATRRDETVVSHQNSAGVADPPRTDAPGVHGQPPGGGSGTGGDGAGSGRGDGPGPRQSSLPVVVLAVIGVLLLVAAGVWVVLDRDTAPEPAPAPTVDVAAQEEAAAFAAAEQTIRSFNAADAEDPSAPPPRDLVTDRYYDEQTEILDTFQENGITTEGADPIASITPGEYSDGTGGPAVTMTVCYEVQARLLDADGNDVRVSPDGEPVEQGDLVGIRYQLKAEDGQTWKINAQEGASC